MLKAKLDIIGPIDHMSPFHCVHIACKTTNKSWNVIVLVIIFSVQYDLSESYFFYPNIIYCHYISVLASALNESCS